MLRWKDLEIPIRMHMFIFRKANLREHFSSGSGSKRQCCSYPCAPMCVAQRNWFAPLGAATNVKALAPHCEMDWIPPGLCTAWPGGPGSHPHAHCKLVSLHEGITWDRPCCAQAPTRQWPSMPQPGRHMVRDAATQVGDAFRPRPVDTMQVISTQSHSQRVLCLC